MPNFTDFLFAPWKIFELLSAPKPVNPLAPPPAGAHGFCSVQDIGGQFLNICNFAGYEMPAFVFWASLAILLLFLGTSAGLFKQCYRIAQVLTRVNRSLKWIQQLENKKLTEQELDKIRSVIAQEKLLAHAWMQFEDGLISSNDGSEVYSTESVDSAFSRAAIIEDNIQTAFFNSIPGILTGLGLLMTFIAILDGLSHVSVTANMDVKGIGGLINGLSGKFVSSIVAVTCAVCFVFVERIAYAAPYQAHRRLITLLSSRFKRRTAEYLLYSIQNQLLAQAASQQREPQPASRAERSRGT